MPRSTTVVGAVWVGTVSTVLCAVVGAVYVALGDRSLHEVVVLWGCIGVAAVAAVVGAAGARRGAPVRRHPWRWLLGWSLLDIALVSAAVAVTGGATSEVSFFYVLPTAFFTALFGPWEQTLLFGSTLVAYAGASVVGGGPFDVGAVGLRVGAITVAAVVSSELAAQLRDQAEQHRRAEMAAERRAQLLALVALSARSLPRLEADDVLAQLVRDVRALGFDAAAVHAVDGDGSRCLHHEGFGPAGPGAEAGELAQRVVASGVSWWPEQVRQVVGDQSEPGQVVPLAATPLSNEHEDGQVVLALGARSRRPIQPEEREAIELVASTASAALVHAERYRLEQATREQLEELTRIQEDFVATASHELRTPLTVVRGLAELLASRWTELDETQRVDFVHRIVRHGIELDRLVERLLEFQQLRAGATVVRPRTVHLAELVSEVLDRTSYLTRHDVVDPDVAPDLEVRADRQLLGSVLEALVDNAARHTPANTHIRIAAREAGIHVVVTVSDDGPGIPPAELEELQEAFRRGGDHHTRPTRGVGLGLATVRHILTLHGTDLLLTSDGGTVATFHLTRAGEPPSSAELARARLAASRVIRLDAAAAPAPDEG